MFYKQGKGSLIQQKFFRLDCPKLLLDFFFWKPNKPKHALGTSMYQGYSLDTGCSQVVGVKFFKKWTSLKDIPRKLPKTHKQILN